MARITIENLTQHRVYVPVPVGLSLGPRKRVTIGQISDDELARSTKISRLIHAGMIAAFVDDNDPDVEDSIEKRLLVSGGVGPGLSNDPPADVATSPFSGVALTASRSDHEHAHSDLPGGTLHAPATTLANGFMSAADKTKLDTLGVGGDVTGPASSTDEAIARFHSTTGKIIQNSNVTIDDAGNINMLASRTVDGRDVSADGATLTSHVANTNNPHFTSLVNIGSATLAQLNSKVTDATLDDSANPRTPTGTASGQLGGTYPSPDVRGVRETAGPTLLSIGSITDGWALIRNGSTITSTPLVGGGDVTGPASSTDTAIVRFNGTGGKIIQDSGVIIDGSNNIVLPSGATVDGRDVSVDGAKVDALSTVAKEVTGFPNLTDTTISFVGGGSHHRLVVHLLQRFRRFDRKSCALGLVRYRTSRDGLLERNHERRIHE